MGLIDTAAAPGSAVSTRVEDRDVAGNSPERGDYPAVSVGKPSWRWSAVVLAAAVFLGTLSGCGAPKYNYVSNGEFGNYFRLPRTWEMKDVTNELGGGRVKADQGSNVTRWEVVLVGPSGTSITSLAVADPQSALLLSPNVVGRVLVIDLGPGPTERVGLSTVRAAFSASKVDPLFPPEELDKDAIEVVSYEPLAFGDALTGSRVVANIDLDPSPTAVSWITESQSMVFNNRTGFVYLLTLACAAECYELHQQQIDEIAASFTVRT